jgi:glycosyltransferase involved in cell wall biosynthesis
MHVVIISDFESGGGAAIATNRLAQGLITAGCKVSRIVFSKDECSHPWNSIALGSLSLSARAMLRFLPKSHKVQFLKERNTLRLKRILAALKPDIVNMHNIHGAQQHGWSSKLADVSCRYAPVVWTLHDMWSFTGRCAYNFECFKYLTGCDHTCPTHDEYPALPPSQIAGAWRSKKRTFTRNSKIVAVSPSQWLAQVAQEGMWASHSVRVIPHGISLDIYRPGSKAAARRKLGLKETGIVALISSASLTERRKANDIAAEALRKRTEQDLTILTMGKGKLFAHQTDRRVQELGYIEGDDAKTEVYNAASLTIHPSLMDNLPNVIIESLACGTPVLAFAKGGISEMVHHRKTGWLASQPNNEAFERTVDEAMNDLRSGTDFMQSCRKLAEAKYDIRSQTQTYLSLFEELSAHR